MKKEIFDELLNGLSEATKDIKKKRAFTQRNTFIPKAPMVNSDKVINIRQDLGMSRGVFAEMLNISPKTVESWETGTKHPSGASLRLLEIAKEQPEVLISKIKIAK